MSEEEQTTVHLAWGIPVPRGANGRYRWPAEVKAMAIQRILSGETVAAVAREIPANESLVAKWAQDHRETLRSAESWPGIVEVVAVADERPAIPSAPPGGACDLHIGDVRLSIPQGYAATHLTEILRAVRASQ